MIITRAPGKMSDDDLRAVVNSRLQVTTANLSSIVTSERAKALKYYRGDLIGNEVDGRSQVISRDVQESIDGLMPSLLKVFASGPPVEFKERAPQFEKAATQITDACNWIWNSQNEGFLTYSTWFKDALMQRIGTVKCWWDKTQTVRKESYIGLTEMEWQMVQRDPSVEVIGMDQQQDPMSGQPLYDVDVKITNKQGRAVVDCIPPEEFLFDYYAKSKSKARIVGERHEFTISDLRELGYEDDLLETIPSGDYLDYSPDKLARYGNMAGPLFMNQGESDPASREVWVTEVYMRVDYDGDGYAEMRKITVAGPNANVMLDNEEVDDDPYSILTPTILPHRIEGVSIADQTMDLQDIKSTLWRQTLDNLYLSNDPQIMVVEDQVTIEDFLQSGPGRIKRVRNIDAAKPFEIPFVAGASMPMIEYADQVRELRTGLPRAGGELDQNILNNSATGANIVNNSRLERVELFARNFAETGVKDAFRKIKELVQKYQVDPMHLRLNGQWVDINPRDWKKEFDMSVSVGLGSGNKDQMLAHLMPLKQTQEQIMLHLGPNNPICGMQEYYNTLASIVKNAGLGDVSKYFKNPQDAPPGQQQPPQPPSPEMMKAQTEMQIMQAKAQLDQQQGQQRMQLDAAKMHHDMQLQAMRAQADIEIAKGKAQAQVQAAAYKDRLEPHPDGPDNGFSIHELHPQALDGAPPLPTAPTLPADVTAAATPTPGTFNDPNAGAVPQGQEAAPQAAPDAAPAAPPSPQSDPEPAQPQQPAQPDQTAQVVAVMSQNMQQVTQAMTEASQANAQAMQMVASALEKLSKPKRLVRGKDGRATGVEHVE